MDDDQQFCLRWNNHQSTLISVFDTLLENETLVDCTLAAEGKFLKAHKVVLSACSPYFATLLQEQYDKHPIFILKDVKYQELRAMMDYMYRGEVNISQDQLAALLKAAESLQIKGLSDNRTGGGNSSGGGVPKHDQHRGLSVPGSSGVLGGGKLSSGYTLEQTKRARMGPSSIDSQDMSGSREGSSSPTSRRRRKVRRRSIENALADVHDNSNSSQIQPNASSALLQQSNASLGGVGAITAAASALASQVPVSAATLPSAAAAAVSASTIATTTQGTTQQLTTATNVTKKTESVKGTSGGDALHTELLVHGGAGGNLDEQQQQHGGLELKSEKLNHKQQKSVLGAGNIKDTSSAAELVIEPKSEYDDDGNDETVEDLTLDDEDMGMEDLDHNAGTSHGNEGSSQGYAQWQHDRSQDEVFMATQEAQQRDPQVFIPISGEAHTSPSLSISSHRRHSLRLKTSPITSPIATPTSSMIGIGATVGGIGVIKYEPSTTDDDSERLTAGGVTPSASAHLGGVTLSRHRSACANNGDDDDDADDNDDDDDEQPCDLRLNSVFMAALQHVAIAAAVEHASPGGATSAADRRAVAAAAAAAIMPHGSVISPSPTTPSGMQTTQQKSPTLLSTATPTASHTHLISFPQPQVPPSSSVKTQSTASATSARRSSSISGAGSVISPLLPPGLSLGSGVSATVLSAGVSSATAAAVAAGSTSSVISVPPAVSATSSTGVAGAGAIGTISAGSSGGGGGTTWGGAYTCERCGNSYARPHSLNRHVRFECGVEPKFECPICHKKSKHKHNLVLHMRTHQHR